VKGLGILVVLVVGIVIGVLGIQMGPDYLKTYLPGPVDPDSGLEGKVVAKLPGEDRLLLTLSTPEGASLITFTEKVAEVGLLVDRGDLLTVGIHRYSPFITNPPIRRVRKEDGPLPAAVEAEREPETPAPVAGEAEEGTTMEAPGDGEAEPDGPAVESEAPSEDEMEGGEPSSAEAEGSPGAPR
jgi:hypothetical protein